MKEKNIAKKNQFKVKKVRKSRSKNHKNKKKNNSKLTVGVNNVPMLVNKKSNNDSKVPIISEEKSDLKFIKSNKKLQETEQVYKSNNIVPDQNLESNKIHPIPDHADELSRVYPSYSIKRKSQFRMPVTRVSTETLAKLPYNRDIQVTVQILQSDPLEESNHIFSHSSPPTFQNTPEKKHPNRSKYSKQTKIPTRKWFLSARRILRPKTNMNRRRPQLKLRPRKRNFYEYDYFYDDSEDYGEL